MRSLRRDTSAPKSGEVPNLRDSDETALRRAADLKALLEAAAQTVPPNEPERWITTEEEGEVLECRFPASLPPSGPPINFDQLREKWNGQIMSVDEETALLEVAPQKKFWKRLLGRTSPLHVEIRWSRPRPPAMGIPGIITRVRLADKEDKSAAASLHELAPDSSKV